MFPIKEGVVTPDGVVVPTAEHLYQSSKFVDDESRARITEAKNGYKAKQLADSLAEAGVPIREDWEEVRINKMRDAVLQSLHAANDWVIYCFQTGDEELIEGNARGDTFWGVSLPEHEGLNWLGKILMETRKQLQASETKS